MLTVLRHQLPESYTSACRVATGRSAVLHMARRCGCKTAVMPSYVPRGILQPFIAAGAQIKFYKLMPDLQPDFASVERELRDVDRGVLVAINYFGMDTNARMLQAMAADSGAVLLLDCAHCIPYSRWDARADVVLYSLNKFLPVADGAIMLSTTPSVDLSITESSFNDLPDNTLISYYHHLENNQLIARATADDDVSQALFFSAESYERYYKYIDKDMRIHRQTERSQQIEMRANFRAMEEARWVRSTLLLHGLDKKFPVRPSNAEFAFPIRCHGKRMAIIQALQDGGVIASMLTDKWDHVPNSDEYATEREFVDDHILLPIAEHIDVNEMNRMAAIINGVV